MKKIKTALIGPFSPPNNGDGIKNDYLKEGFDAMLSQPIECVDTIYRGQGRLRFVWRLLSLMMRSGQVVISLNKYGRILIIPFFSILKLVTSKRAVLFVIGGSFDQQLQDHPWIFRRLFVWAINRLDGVLAESYRLNNGLMQVGVVNSAVIYNPRKDSGHRWHLTEDVCNKIVFVSRVTASKGIFDLMDAVLSIHHNQQKSLVLHVFGHVDPSCGAEFNRRIASHPNLFVYGGVLAPQDVQETLSHFHLLALPTFHYGEGLPGVLVEAGFAGIPMVMTRFNSLDEYFTDGESACFVECRDVDELARKISLLLADDELAIRIAHGGQQITAPFHLQRVMNDVKLYLLSKGWELN